MITCFPDPYPDELIHNVYARYDERMQYRKPSVLLEELFGTGTRAIPTGFSYKLEHLVKSLPPAHLYSADYLIDNHTLMPFFAPFLPTSLAEGVREYMKGNKTQKEGLKLMRGLSNLQTSRPRFFRYCPLCVLADREQYNECYWHRSHQLPRIRVCPTHGVYLSDSDLQVRGLINTKFVSAEQSIAKMELPLTGQVKANPFLFQIALDAVWLLENSRPGTILEDLSSRYINLLIEHDLATYSGTIRAQKLIETFQTRYSPDLLKELGAEIDEQNPHNWLIRLVSSRGKSRFQHPVHHLLMIRFLEHLPQTFFNLPTKRHYFGESPWACLNPVCTHYRNRVIQNCDISYDKEGLPVGIFKCTCGFAYQRKGPDRSQDDQLRLDRIISFGSKWETTLKELWQDLELSISQVAIQLQVSTHTIRKQAERLKLPPRCTAKRRLSPRKREIYRNKWLTVMNKYPKACYSELYSKFRAISGWLERNDKEWWQKHRPLVKKRGIDQGDYRARFLQAVQDYPIAIITELRSIIGGVYSWLWRHDRDWLQKHRPSSKKGNQGKAKTATDWEFLDQKLAKEVQEIANDLKRASGRPVFVTKTKISKRITQQYLWNQHRDKFPQTVRTLTEVAENRVEFAIRRIRWAVEWYLNESIVPTRCQLIQKACVYKLRELTLIKIAIDEAMVLLSDSSSKKVTLT